MADRPPDAMLQMQCPPESKPLPGLRPDVHLSSREQSFQIEESNSLTHT